MPIPWLLPAIAATVSAVASGGPRRQYKWNKRAAQDTYEMNRKIQEEQRAYDAPKAQMSRYLEAGLNPNMIYGGGSASAGGAFPFSYKVEPPSARYPDVGQAYLQASQLSAQTDYTQARTSESYVNQALKEIQTDIAKTNPMLQPWVAEWVATSMSETARLKALESRQWMSSQDGQRRYAQKIEAEIDAMTQKLGLNTADLAIKNRILESKEFENAVKQIQAEWLKDGNMTPEHIRQGMMLILGKMLGIVNKGY